MTDQRLSSEQLDPEIDEITEEMDDLIQKRTRLLKKLSASSAETWWNDGSLLNDILTYLDDRGSPPLFVGIENRELGELIDNLSQLYEVGRQLEAPIEKIKKHLETIRDYAAHEMTSSAPDFDQIGSESVTLGSTRPIAGERDFAPAAQRAQAPILSEEKWTILLYRADVQSLTDELEQARVSENHIWRKRLKHLNNLKQQIEAATRTYDENLKKAGKKQQDEVRETLVGLLDAAEQVKPECFFAVHIEWFEIYNKLVTKLTDISRDETLKQRFYTLDSQLENKKDLGFSWFIAGQTRPWGEELDYGFLTGEKPVESAPQPTDTETKQTAALDTTSPMPPSKPKTPSRVRRVTKVVGLVALEIVILIGIYFAGIYFGIFADTGEPSTQVSDLAHPTATPASPTPTVEPSHTPTPSPTAVSSATPTLVTPPVTIIPASVSIGSDPPPGGDGVIHVKEGGSVTVTTSLPETASDAQQVKCQLHNGAASGGGDTVKNAEEGDYQALSDFDQVFALQPGDKSERTVEILDDPVYEGEEAFSISCTKPDGAPLSENPPVFTVVIEDNDTPPTLTIEALPVNEGDASGQPLSVAKVTVNGETELPITVHYTIQPTPSSGFDSNDYTVETLLKNTLTFEPGEKEKEIPLAIVDDQVVESGDETFSVTLSGPENATIVPTGSNVTVWIRDNDKAQVALVAPTEPVTESSNQAVFTVTIRPPLNRPVTVNYTVSGSEKCTFSSSTTIRANEPSAEIDVPTVPNDVDEDDVECTVTLEPPAGDDVALAHQPEQATVRIQDDDPPTLNVTAENLPRGISLDAQDGQAATLTLPESHEPVPLTLTISDSKKGAVDVQSQLEALDSTSATMTTDYVVITPQMWRLVPGVGQTIQITAKKDDQPEEEPEAFAIVFTTPSDSDPDQPDRLFTLTVQINDAEFTQYQPGDLQGSVALENIADLGSTEEGSVGAWAYGLTSDGQRCTYSTVNSTVVIDDGDSTTEPVQISEAQMPCNVYAVRQYLPDTETPGTLELVYTLRDTEGNPVPPGQVVEVNLNSGAQQVQMWVNDQAIESVPGEPRGLSEGDKQVAIMASQPILDFFTDEAATNNQGQIVVKIQFSDSDDLAWITTLGEAFLTFGAPDGSVEWVRLQPERKNVAIHEYGNSKVGIEYEVNAVQFFNSRAQQHFYGTGENPPFSDFFEGSIYLWVPVEILNITDQPFDQLDMWRLQVRTGNSTEEPASSSGESNEPFFEFNLVQSFFDENSIWYCYGIECFPSVDRTQKKQKEENSFVGVASGSELVCSAGYRGSDTCFDSQSITGLNTEVWGQYRVQVLGIIQSENQGEEQHYFALVRFPVSFEKPSD